MSLIVKLDFSRRVPVGLMATMARAKPDEVALRDGGLQPK